MKFVFIIHHLLNRCFLFLFLLPVLVICQTNDIIQISGLVLNSDRARGIPYAHVIVKNRAQGTICDFDGFFSIPAAKGDTIQFSSVGYINNFFIISDTLNSNYYSIKQVLIPDTMTLQEIVLYPWPSKENFKQEFLALEPPVDDLERARRNLEITSLLRVAMNMNNDKQAMQDYAIAAQNNAIYNASMYYGLDGKQAMLAQFTNPFAWAEFIKALKNGDLNLRR